MKFDSAAYLRKATSRAKSDVANKLISMFLHEISRRVVSSVGMGVTDPVYTREVVATFGDKCAYCQRVLEADRAAVEHLEGMNRFRIGLHVPGNVVLACKKCNSSKRYDDQQPSLLLADSGWESFLSHDGMRCSVDCKTCAYWQLIWPDAVERTQMLQATAKRIGDFRRTYTTSSDWSARTRAAIKDKINVLYRECQESANSQIQAAATALFEELNGNRSNVVNSPKSSVVE
jgi:hypothetical protein